MVRDVRVKQYIFPSQDVTALTTSTAQSSHVINGEILSVEHSFNGVGSVFLTISGTGEEFFRRNVGSVGPSVLVVQPRVFTQTTTGSIANASHVPFVTNNPIILNYAGASGTNAIDVTVRYR